MKNTNEKEEAAKMKNRIKLSKVACFISLTMVAGGLSSNAYAQDNGPVVLEELIVTARKVSESIQDIPIAITAFSAEQISNSSIEELEDIALLTPGLTFEDYSNGGFGTPIIRGASQFSVDQLEQNVSTFLDGVYIPRGYALDVGTLDMERIEVVKGPQSALHGANAFMGAINYITSTPNLDELEGDVGVVFGDGGRQDVSAKISVPLIPEKLAIRFSAGATEYDGDWTNSHPAASAGVSPGTDDTLGGWDNSSFSFSLLAKPTERLSFELAYHSFDVSTESRAQSRLELGDLNCGGSSFGGPLRGFCGELPETPLEAGTGNPIGFLIDPRTYGLESESNILRTSIEAQINDNLTLSYQFANIEGDVFSAGGSDRDPLTGTLNVFGDGNFGNAFTVLPVGGFDYDSHEVRLELAADNGVYAMLGVFSSDGEDLDSGANGYFAPLFTDSLAPITEQTLENIPRNNFLTETKLSAIFGRVAVPLIDDKLTLAVEGRYTDETKDINIVYNDGTSADQYEDTYFTPRISLDYSLNDDQLIYVSAARGVKSGGLNGEIAGGLELTERLCGPDENTTYELGSKNTFFDARMQLNATLYKVDWENLQVSQGAVNGGFFTTSIVGNLGAATSKGIELDMTYALSNALRFNAGLALNDASYDNGTVSQRLDRASICDDIVCSANGDISGNSLPRSSDTQWNIGLQYDGSFNNGIEYFLRTDVASQSKQYISEANIGTIPSRTLVNVRAGLSKDRWSAELWIKNAADERYVSNAFYIPNPFFIALVPTQGNQRRIGVSVNYSF